MSTISVTNINDGDAVTAASINNQVNTIVNDYNGNITAVNLATNAITTAKITNANVTADKLALGGATTAVATSENTASSSYVALATAQATTVTIGANGLAWVSVTANWSNNTGTGTGWASFAVSGASTLAASDTNAGSLQAFTAGATGSISWSGLVTGLTAGSNTFSAQFKNTVAGTSTFSNRKISVVPL